MSSHRRALSALDVVEGTAAVTALRAVTIELGWKHGTRRRQLVLRQHLVVNDLDKVRFVLFDFLQHGH